MKKPTVESLIAEIKARLTTIEEYMAWLIRADQRFKVGQRVEWSRAGKRAGFPHRKVAQRGTVRALDSLSIEVLLDGYTRPHSFHHSFFNPVSGPKLF
jgi:hypothetical protein